MKKSDLTGDKKKGKSGNKSPKLKRKKKKSSKSNKKSGQGEGKDDDLMFVQKSIHIKDFKNPSPEKQDNETASKKKNKKYVEVLEV